VTPALLVLTDRRQAQQAGRSLPETVARAVAGGAPAVLFREKDLPAEARRSLGAEVAEACAGAALFVASDPDLAEELGGVGVHLAADDPWPETDLARGRSCHDQGGVTAAAQEGATYVTVSPVFATASKPGYGPPLGLCGLAGITGRSAVPVVALGGLTPGRAEACRRAGAAGVAVMGAVMAAPDPEAVVGRLLEGP
jgi:thiamine-phosphate pyrophosphorylase